MLLQLVICCASAVDCLTTEHDICSWKTEQTMSLDIHLSAVQLAG
jgi:hypothetical protein